MKNSFVSGCTNFQHSALVRHIDVNAKDGAAGQHLRALEIIKQQKTFKVVVENQVAKSQNEEKQLRTVYWLAKEEVAEAKFASLIALQVSLSFLVYSS